MNMYASILFGERNCKHFCKMYFTFPYPTVRNTKYKQEVAYLPICGDCCSRGHSILIPRPSHFPTRPRSRPGHYWEKKRPKTEARFEVSNSDGNTFEVYSYFGVYFFQLR